MKSARSVDAIHSMVALFEGQAQFLVSLGTITEEGS